METYIPLLIGIITFLGGMISLYYSRRLLRSQARDMDATAFEKFTTTLTTLQERNDSLYQENVSLQVKVTNIERTNQALAVRLEERDAQLTTTTRQLDLLRELARTAPITESLQKELAAMTGIVQAVQAAEAETKSLLKSREAAYNELFSSTQDLIKANNKRKQTTES